jgi:hypothetical protein
MLPRPTTTGRPKGGIDDLEFDELDPCCQKEIVDKRRKAEISAQLRTIDRSNDRLDARRTVFNWAR